MIGLLLAVLLAYPDAPLPTAVGFRHFPAVSDAAADAPHRPTLDSLLADLGLLDRVRRGELRLDLPRRLSRSEAWTLRQFWRGLPVIGAHLALRLAADGRLLSVHGTLLDLPPAPSTPPEPAVSASSAVTAARARIRPRLLRASPRTEPAALPRPQGIVPVWRVLLPAADPLGDWEVLVSAVTGEVLQVEDRLQRVDGLGRVFDPDPVTATGDTTLDDRADAAEAVPDEAYTEVRLLDLIPLDDSTYALEGPLVSTAPTPDRARLNTPRFLFDRADDRFEEVMAYYHLSRQAAYVRALGFPDLPPAPQPVEVNGTDQDLSFFSPATGIITTGTGGVDDAEDADVLIHEYTHALLHRIIPDWRGGDAALLTEGVCDYFAGDLSLSLAPGFRPYEIFNWDGHNRFWPGRVLNAPYRYPDDVGREPHDAGQLWAAALIQIRQAVPDRDRFNQLVLDHLFSLADSARVPDAAAALLASDVALNQGAWRRYLLPPLLERGILPPGLYSPRIAHRPLPDTEDLDAPRPVPCAITGPLPLDSTSLWLVWRFAAADPESARLRPLEADTLFQAEIPAPGHPTEVRYYLTAADTAGAPARDPLAAPLSWHRFFAGPDTTPPIVLELDSLPETVFPVGEAVVSARVADNLGIADAALVWFHGRMRPGGLCAMAPDSARPDWFYGKLRWDMGGDESVSYLVAVTDAARAANSAASRRMAFTLQPQAVLDDFEHPSPRWRLVGWGRSPHQPCRGEWCLQGLPPESSPAVAEPDEFWNLAQFDRFYLSFWERRRLLPSRAVRGTVELSADSGRTWQTLLSLTGAADNWRAWNLDLSNWCLGRSGPVKVRWTVTADSAAAAGSFWAIDYISLRVGNVVAALEPLPPHSPLRLDFPRPNPANRRLVVAGFTPASARLTLFDLTGRQIDDWHLSPGRFTLDLPLPYLPNGTYLVRLEAAGQTVQRLFQNVR